MIQIQTLQKLAEQRKKTKSSIAFVPTMGALHTGHLSLIEEAQKKSQQVWVSIFVNPSQFTNAQDFEKYPNTLQSDIEKLKKLKVDVLFTPESSHFYDEKFFPEWVIKKEKIKLPKLFSCSEGKTRKGHFEGVFQVLYRLFGIIQPDIALFGQKDFQQTLLVQYLQSQYFPKLSIEVCPIIRESSGLALSSRNARLSNDARKKASILYSSLQKIQTLFSSGETAVEKLYIAGISLLQSEPLIEHIYYYEFRDSKTFQQHIKTVSAGDIVLISVEYAGVHLLDNIILS